MSAARQTRNRRSVAGAVVLGAMVVATAGCGWGVGVAYPVGYYDDYPPDSYIVTTEPVYFEGRATYWYGGRWYYRDGRRWSHYDREPQALERRRIEAPPARRMYERRERPAGRAAPREAARPGVHR
jgi:hypothetical protein